MLKVSCPSLQPAPELTESPSFLFGLAWEGNLHLSVNHIPAIIRVSRFGVCNPSQNDVRVATGSNLNILEDLVEGLLDIIGHPGLRLAQRRFASIITIMHRDVHVFVQGQL
jgi:hypothetical protein